MAGKRRNRVRLAVAFAVAVCANASQTAFADPPGPPYLGRVCGLIAAHADQNDLPRAFLARLIWKESRFDPNAVSPKGAEGVAQFMPGTARMRGLEDAFDIEQAIPAAAIYLAELSTKFGNFGLAAAAYNSGEGRVSRWLASGGFLPLETENYVLDIMGAPADTFAGVRGEVEAPPLHKTKSFSRACLDLPTARFQTVAMSTVPVQPWGIQVAGSFNRAAAIRQWQTVKGRNPTLFANVEPVISRVRSPIGRRGIYAVRVGAETRGEADALCAGLRRVGGACIVTRNR